MRISKLKAYVLLSSILLTPNLYAADDFNDPVPEEEIMQVLEGARYGIYMRKMIEAEKLRISSGLSEASEFIEALNQEQGGTNDIPISPTGKTEVRRYYSYQQLIDDTEVPDDVKNMALSDFGLSLKSDFTKVAPLEGSIVLDGFLSDVAVERTAGQYEDTQPAYVDMDDLFNENGLGDMTTEASTAEIAGMMDAVYDIDPSTGFVNKAYAGWGSKLKSFFKRLDKSKTKTKTKKKDFNIQQLLAALNRTNSAATLSTDGDVKMNGYVQMKLQFTERSLAGIPYKWKFNYFDTNVYFNAKTPDTGAVINGEIFLDGGGDILSAMKILDLEYSYEYWLGPIRFKAKMNFWTEIGMKFYYWIRGKMDGRIYADGFYNTTYRCDTGSCKVISEQNTLKFDSGKMNGEVSGEITLYPWVEMAARLKLEALFFKIGSFQVTAGAAYKMGIWGYIGNTCRIDGTVPPKYDTAWLFYQNLMMWGRMDSYVFGSRRTAPLKLAGTPGRDGWGEPTSYDKALFGINGGTYSATRLVSISGDKSWLDPYLELPKKLNIGDNVVANMKFRPCLPESLTNNVFNVNIDYGDGIETIPADSDRTIKKAYPYVTPGVRNVRVWTSSVGKVGLRGRGYTKQLEIVEPTFETNIEGGSNKSNIPQNSILFN